MRIRRKSKQPGMPPDQVEALARLSPDDFSAILHNLGMPPEKVEAPVDSSALALWVRSSPDSRASVGKEAAERFARASGRSPGCLGEAGAQGCGPELPPLLIGGESSQVLQTGESIVLDRNQSPVIRPGVRCINGQKVGIDWVSCVFEPSSSWMYFFLSEINGTPDFISDDVRVAEYIKDIFAWILGFNRSDEQARWKVYQNGLNGYKYAIGMPHRAGIVHVGHSSGTALVTVSGHGALIAAPGWEGRLHRFLSDVKGWLTRIDMAFDDYEGDYFPVRVMREKAKEGAFARGGRPPKIELRGSWEQDDPNNSGLTLYVGSRMSGKFTRIYEKGKQLGDELSPWVRAEVELHNSCYQLTLAMLLKPTRWFVAFYPCFEVIESGADRAELEYRKRIASSTLEHSAKWIKHQAGGHLAALRQFYSDSELLDLLVRPDAIPETFLAANFACENLFAPADCLQAEPGFIEA